ncbi:sugar ABC transporter ATP-binding protein [Nonomuraea sp. KC401]|uniref:sugar ABC transporter ATP-binding protein n=1 Tax=unclassified Nonomuraea TaxID=2593643 RepID=UPI0010FE89C0|nr:MULTISPECIES: sugar ABC transporter ATP-binding protein [unclassified Nonomuraea]NBE96538.1 ATP-binding cassette domain-containing protein [Nonomuraea sp. K271]TLF68599.1 sugar ABC transporter ATP-binding protein [Nonomuraea sp. KC401]
MNHHVEARNVVKRFGPTTALDRAGIEIAEGETRALVGRNGAGKSTLVSILTGLLRPDQGEVLFSGEPAPPIADRDAWRQRVACVYQHSTIIPALSVAENLFLNRQPGRGGLIRWRALRDRARELLDTYEVDVDAQALAGELTVEQRQLVEIARALSFGARFIILDEPTARLDGPAIERLFARMRSLREQGVTMLYISHHLDEVYEICQSVTVFRDARHIVTSPVADLPHDELVAAMTGEATVAYTSRSRTPGGTVVLSGEGLSLAGRYQDVDLTVRSGEVVGLAGSASSGKVGLAETLVGLHRADSGTVTVNGRRLRPGDVPAALRAGLGWVPQDRHREGFVPRLSVGENATFPIARKLGRYGLVSPSRRRAKAEELIENLDIKTEGADQPVGDLSGGNAQKVVFARALVDDPDVLVVINPTAGVDVKAKQALLGAVEDAVERGAGAVVVSDELDDLRICDRVLVMFHGRVVKDLPRGWTDHELVAVMEGMEE